MSNVSIYEKKWLDLVFEDKNKTYGAYQLRQENSRTTLLALFSGMLFISSLFGVWLLFSSFDDKPVADPVIPTLDEVITPVDLSKPPRIKTIIPKVKQPQVQSTVQPINIANIVAAAPSQVTVEVPKNTDLVPQSSDTGTTTGTDAGPGTPFENGGVATTGTVDSNATRTTNELDRLPEYPGGIKKFYEYVGRTIDKPEVDDNVMAVSVIMSFVIERDGSMTDIKAIRSSDKGLEREAVRVLKALKVKWSPGFKDGEKVRTQYMLPIKVTL